MAAACVRTGTPAGQVSRSRARSAGRRLQHSRCRKGIEVFTPDATYQDLFYGTHRGHDGLRRLFGRMYAEGTHREWTMTTVVVGQDVTIGEWDFGFTLSDIVPQGSGRTLRFRGVSVFATRAARCHTYREYGSRLGRHRGHRPLLQPGPQSR